MNPAFIALLCVLIIALGLGTTWTIKNHVKKQPAPPTLLEEIKASVAEAQREMIKHEGEREYADFTARYYAARMQRLQGVAQELHEAEVQVNLTFPAIEVQPLPKGFLESLRAHKHEGAV